MDAVVWTRRATLRIAILIAASACKSPHDNPPTSDVNFAQGMGGATHGHEKLTELAVKMANDVLETYYGDRPRGFTKTLPRTAGDGSTEPQFYPEDQISQAAGRNSHPTIWGSLTADFPSVTRGIPITALMAHPNRDTSRDKLTFLNYALCKHYGLAGSSGNIEADLRPNLKVCDGMATDGAYQDVHFLRKWKGEVDLETGKAACEGGRERIRSSTLTALEKWQSRSDPRGEGDDVQRYPRFMGLYFIGLALHTVQDSFSGAHVVRDVDHPRMIEKICHYNDQVIKQNLSPNICRHKVPFDPRDLIWKKDVRGALSTTKYITGGISTLRNRLGGDLDNLTAEGQGATIASAAYLLTFAKILSELPRAADGGVIYDGGPESLKIVDRELDVFFNYEGSGETTDPRLIGSGYLNCNKVGETI